MKRFAILLLLFACSTPDPGIAVDAGIAIDSASFDAPRPSESGNGCGMGNLPKSRTITVGAADQLPSAVIDELQDRDIAQGGQRDVYVGGGGFCAASGTATLSGRVWTLNTISSVTANVFLQVGTVITDFRFSYNGAAGASALVGTISRRSFGDGGVTSGAVITSNGAVGAAAWAISAAPSGSPYTLLAGFYYDITISLGTSTGAVLFDGVKISVNGP